MTFDHKKLGPPWSFSRIRAFACPLRAAYRYIAGREEPTNEAALVGKAAHALTALYRQRYLETGVCMSAAEIEEEARRLDADPKVADRACEVVIGATAMNDLLPPRNMIRQAWVEEPIAIDRAGKPVAFDDERAFFRGIVDFAWIDTSGVLHVEDDKVGAPGETLQLRCYAFILALVAGIRPAEIRLTFNVLARSFRESSTTGWSDLVDAPAWIEGAVKKITALREFNPVVGQSCDFCGFKSDCPEYQAAAHELAVRETRWEIVTNEQARKAVQFLSLAEDYVETVKELLRAYVETAGPVAAAGKVAELRESENWDANPETIAGALLTLGVPRHILWRHVSITKTAVGKVLKDAGMKDRTGDILALGTTSKKTRFGLYRDALTA